jgi:hypothetical protein
MGAIQIRNYTRRLRRAEAFVRAKCELVRTRGLSIHIKYTRAYDAEISGYYRWDDRRIVVAVQPGLRYPFRAAYSVAYAGRGRRSRLSRQPIWYEELFYSADDLLVFVAGHEMWHYLCHTRQRRCDQENKANCNGFLWLREFKRWRGPNARVARIPVAPPRPDKRRLEQAAKIQRIVGPDGVVVKVRTRGTTRSRTHSKVPNATGARARSSRGARAARSRTSQARTSRGAPAAHSRTSQARTRHTR